MLSRLKLASLNYVITNLRHYSNDALLKFDYENDEDFSVTIHEAKELLVRRSSCENISAAGTGY